MGKKLLFVSVVVLAVSSTTLADSFWGLLFNGAFHIGAQPPDVRANSGSFPGPQPSGSASQLAVAGGSGGLSGVGQVAGATGAQTTGVNTQQQNLTAGLGQVGFTFGGPGGAFGVQSGNVNISQTTTSPTGTATQSQQVAGTQQLVVVGSPGSAAVVVQTATTQTEQSQQY